jgi:hypothetical protein
VNRRQSLIVVAVAVAVAPWALACRKRASPEDRVRALLASLEQAVQAGDLGPVREALSPLFSGNDNLDKAGALAALQLRLRSQKQIYLFTRILNVETAAGEAGAELLVAMAGVPIPGPEALPRLEADVYRFQLALLEDVDAPQGYRVKTAAWSPARWPE